MAPKGGGDEAHHESGGGGALLRARRAPVRPRRPGAGGAGRDGARVDLNSASVEELAQLPGIGPAKAQAIVSHRSADPFRKPEDLRKVKGIGDKLYEQLKDQITVSGPAAGSSDRGG